MGRNLLFLVTGFTILFGIIQSNTSKRIASIPNSFSKYYKIQQARSLSSAITEYAAKSFKLTLQPDLDIRKNTRRKGEFNTLDLIDSTKFKTRSYSARKDYILGRINEATLNQIELNNRNTFDQATYNLSTNLSAYSLISDDLPEDTKVELMDGYSIALFGYSTYDDVTVLSEAIIKKEPFTKYSYFSDQENNLVTFSTGDTINGHVHTNEHFTFKGTPTFLGLVTSMDEWTTNANADPALPNFNGGKDILTFLNWRGESSQYDELDFPKSPGADEVINASLNGGKNYPNDIDILFYHNNNGGFAEISFLNTATPPQTVIDTVRLDSTNGAIVSNGSVSIQGELFGAVTIYAANDIHITGDITYRTNPIYNTGSTDRLGLLTNGNFIVDANAHNVLGVNDLDIFGALISFNGSLVLEDLNDGVLRGDLNFFGSLLQKHSAIIGTLDEDGNVISGFRRRHRHDKRLAELVPPFYPRAKDFSLIYWKDKILKQDRIFTQ